MVSYDKIGLEEILSDAPFILGGHYINSDWALSLFGRYLSILKTLEIESSPLRPTEISPA